ncbi:MAG: hypothetical protein LBG16_01930 [Elusimicrobiota bacterium]|jgi:hypothetical protein|nr:hypothetical protein [Elusimicrobiota bacterium]
MANTFWRAVQAGQFLSPFLGLDKLHLPRIIKARAADYSLAVAQEVQIPTEGALPKIFENI